MCNKNSVRNFIRKIPQQGQAVSGRFPSFPEGKRGNGKQPPEFRTDCGIPDGIRKIPSGIRNPETAEEQKARLALDPRFAAWAAGAKA
jgi:hypothetical protein